MNVTRRRELQASLECELDRNTVDHDLDSAGRVVWLFDQLQNYLERWLGLRGGQGQNLADDDLFGMLEIGAEVTSRELRPRDSESWQLWLTALAEVRAGGTMVEPRHLAESLARVRSEFCPQDRT